jgi:peptide-methionine (S)-S-oxide reductase
MKRLTKRLTKRFTKRLLTLLTVTLLSLLLTVPIAAQAAPTASPTPGLAQATFAGGCFWCMEQPFDNLPGVLSTTSGYTGGTVVDPTYPQVSDGNTGHAESVQVLYDPKRISYDTLLEAYWNNIDPIDPDGQFCDRGSQYRSAIFYHNDEQQQAAQKSKQNLTQIHTLSGPIVTEITAAQPFYAAEDYHQNFYKTHSLKYQFYRRACGRDRRLAKLWGGAAQH